MLVNMGKENIKNVDRVTETNLRCWVRTCYLTFRSVQNFKCLLGVVLLCFYLYNTVNA